METLAYAVEIDNMTCIVFAATLPKARYIAVMNYWDAFGRRKGEWPRAVGWREPRFDNRIPGSHQSGKAYSREFIEGCRS